MSEKNTRRRCLDIKFKEDTSKRLVTFSKRRNGLFSKAKKLSDLTGAQIAVLVLSRSGRPYSFGCPNVDTVIGRFLASPADKEREWWDVPMEGMGLEELRRYKDFLEGLRENLATKQPQEPAVPDHDDQMVIKVETQQCSCESESTSFWLPGDDLVSLELDDIFHDQEGGFTSLDLMEPFSFDFQ